MSKGRIFHLEDKDDWIQRVNKLLGDEHDLYSASSLEEAALLFRELAEEGLKFDLAIIDISLIKDDPHDKQGLEFIEALEKSNVMLGHSIIVLSGYSHIDENLRTAFRDYDVVDVFDKGKFADEKSHFVKTIEETIGKLKV
jgi:CheY-like chemotaxis protein